jgi:hypothetical protein
MMFFQAVLLLGYLYAYCILRYLGPAARTATHVALLAASLWMLPVRPWGGAVTGNPTVAILLALAGSVGLPFFLLSSTGPLVQSWLAGKRGAPLPYWLFALSNAACLVALLGYPLAIEPALPSAAQLRWWSAGYGAVAVLLIATAIQNRMWRYTDESEKPEAEAPEPNPPRPVLWILLSACASVLWLAVANHLSQEVAAIPFLWVLPMTVYLATFVVCFASERWYRREWFRWLLPAAWIAMGSRLGLAGGASDLRVDIPAMLAALLVLCLFCHGELARGKPGRRQGLPFFYLMAAAGGALGGLFVGVAAPLIFSGYLELPLAVVASVFLGLVLVYGVASRGRLLRLGGLAAAAFVVSSTFHGDSTTIASGRNFYGALQVRESGAGEAAVRTMYNGRTEHGAQFLADSLRRTPTAYYGRWSGAGILFEGLGAAPRRAALVGLGAGTLAAYGRKGDVFRFYDVNPAVIEAARSRFRFLADSAAAVEVVNGDGRLRLEAEPPRSFDAIVLDAFSDDAIPVHLLTREAFRIYFERLREGGPLAIHITNRYLDLAPVVESLARALGKTAVLFHSNADPADQTLTADWAIVSDAGPVIEILRRRGAVSAGRAGPLWTDEYSNLFQALR